MQIYYFLQTFFYNQPISSKQFFKKNWKSIWSYRLNKMTGKNRIVQLVYVNG